MVIGSSGLPETFISCMSAFPIEVGRNETCTVLPSNSLDGGSIDIDPCHDPASVFSWSNDFCASDFCASGFCISCAHITLAYPSTATTAKERSDFTCVSCNLKFPVFRAPAVCYCYT